MPKTQAVTKHIIDSAAKAGGSTNKKMIPEHLITETLHVVSVDPDHAQRRETPEFRNAKARLKADGHWHCDVCGTTENLEVHHRIEYHWAHIVDFDKLKSWCEHNDIYGYGRLLKKIPITSIDDVRVMRVLCHSHHVGINHADGGMGIGIHKTDEPTFEIQAVAKDGAIPVPQEGETLTDVLNRIKKAETSS